jgi:hypothetical protein
VTATLREIRYDEACSVCSRLIPAGSKAWVDKVGPRWKRWHEDHGADQRGVIPVTPVASPPPASSKGEGGAPAGTSGLPVAPPQTPVALDSGNVKPESVLVHFGGEFFIEEGGPGDKVEWSYNPKYGGMLPFVGMAEQAEQIARTAYQLAKRIRQGRFDSVLPPEKQ